MHTTIRDRRCNRRQFGVLSAAGLGGLALPGLANKHAAQAAPASALPEGAFTLAVLPDTQVYCERFPQHFHKQAEWIAAHQKSRNILMTLHLGDITNKNLPAQWEVARAAMAKLPGDMGYAMVPGNHDYGDGGSANERTTLLNDYFPYEDAERRPFFYGSMEKGRLENTYHAFKAGGHSYLVIGLEWSPRDKTVAWANEIAAKFPDHRKILITHAYMYFDDTRYDWEKHGAKQHWNPHSYPTAKAGGANDGEQLWRKLVSKHPGFILTLNGHVLNDGQARLTSQGVAGQPVHQMLTNFQTLHEGGDGWMRLLEFSPDGDTIRATTYSPSLDKFNTDEQHQFTLSLRRQGARRFVNDLLAPTKAP